MMNGSKLFSVRISGITIKNFKNVLHGHLDFENDRKTYDASVLGLYGQNGSGKTALVDALELLSLALCGKPVPEVFADFINLDSDYATLEYSFALYEGKTSIPVTYQFSISSFLDESQHNSENTMAGGSIRKVKVFDEILKCPIQSQRKTKLGRLIDTHAALFAPEAKKILLIGKEKNNDMNLMVEKRLSQVQSRSFIFSRELLTRMRKREGVIPESAEEKEFLYYISIIESLVNFGNNCLFVINSTNSGLISLNAQPIIFRYREESMSALGSLVIHLGEDSTVVPVHAKDIVEKVILNMNTVLNQLVPNLTIGVKVLSPETLQSGESGYRIQLVSYKNNREISLKYESEGIKKIVSILNLLIAVYNHKSTTVVVDELDSGIFEYLLGELLKIISEKGKGQLIFTSHNLRPLETLDKGFVAFTTVNPENRYIRMVGVKENNNLRDFYYRDITLGEQKEALYEQTNDAEIAFAFREAGTFRG